MFNLRTTLTALIAVSAITSVAANAKAEQETRGTVLDQMVVQAMQTTREDIMNNTLQDVLVASYHVSNNNDVLIAEVTIQDIESPESE